ncbi:MAG: hypothetical protein IKN21_00090, partial [Prevotella sp.]|nr:hypothetical protein [Prevotella sp.]
AIDNGGDGKGQPSHHVVHKLVLFHSFVCFILFTFEKQKKFFQLAKLQRKNEKPTGQEPIFRITNGFYGYFTF